MLETPDVAEIVECALSQFLEESSSDPLNLRKLAAELHVMPLFYGWFRCLALRPNGELISFDIDPLAGIPPGDIRVEENPITRNLALFQGSIKYPIFQQLIPRRPPDASVCPQCGGKGEFPEPHQQIICVCGGLGWLPPLAALDQGWDRSLR